MEELAPDSSLELDYTHTQHRLTYLLTFKHVGVPTDVSEIAYRLCSIRPFLVTLLKSLLFSELWLPTSEWWEMTFYFYR